MVYSYDRGNKTYLDENGVWRYCEDDSVDDDSKPCVRCGKMPNPDGSDACLGHIEGAIAACCGHGAEKGYVMYPRIKKSPKSIKKPLAKQGIVAEPIWTREGY